MASSTERLRLHEDYAKAFSAWALDDDADALELAHEVGRDALRAGLGLLDVLEVHAEVVTGFGATPHTAGRFLREALSVFELAHRSFADAHRTVQLEQAHAERLARLADATVAIAAASTVEAVLSVTVEAARELVEAAGARAWVAAVDEFPGASAGDADRPTPGLHMALTASDGTSLGALVVWPTPGAPFGRNDEAVLVQLAQMAVVAVQKARLFQREHGIAVTLQRTLLVQNLPVTPSVELAARYLPAGRGAEVGGDFYDVVVLPGDRLALAVGDVTGRGVRAAAVMGQLRIALRAYAVKDLSPREVLDSLDRLLQSLGDAPLATALFGVLDPAARTLRLSNAGHPPPLLVGPDGTPRFLTGGVVPPLGVLPDSVHDEVEIAIEPGSTLLLYTDGLVESREVALDRGLARLAAAAGARVGARLDEVCDGVLADLLPDGTDDDVALLACRVVSPGS